MINEICALCQHYRLPSNSEVLDELKYFKDNSKEPEMQAIVSDEIFKFLTGQETIRTRSMVKGVRTCSAMLKMQSDDGSTDCQSTSGEFLPLDLRTKQ